MSESENKAERDPNGFLNCQKLCISTSQQCSRRYLTVVGFENHVKVEHSDLNRKQTEEQQDAKLTPYQCQECMKSFGQKHVLKDHINVVHKKLTPHQCQECQKSYSQKGKLQNHIEIIHRKFTPYQCQECKKSFGRKASLQKHIKTLHQI